MNSMKADDISHHTSQRYNQHLGSVRARVLEMGGFVERQLSRSLIALMEADSALGYAVGGEDSHVNSMELAVDDECSRILATRAPTAGDLRMVVAIIKASTDLERIGDECQKLGYIAAKLATLDRPADRAQRRYRLTGGMLHRRDLAADLLGRLGGLSREILHLPRHHRETFSRIARPSRLDRRVQRQQVGPSGDVADQSHHRADPVSRIA